MIRAHLRPVDHYSIEYIALHLRDQDAREIYGMRPYDTPFALAQEVSFRFRAPHDQARGAIAWFDGKPCALIGFIQQHPQMWNAIAFGTDDWRNVAIDLMRWARRQAQALVDEGIGSRLQAISHEQSTEAHKFLTALGARKEAEAPLYGKDGATYYTFAWLKGDEVRDAKLHT